LAESGNKGLSLYARLSFMMFLQFAVWGAWSVMIAPHMNNLHFTGLQIGLVFGTTAWGAIVAPLIAGWIADRYMPSQIFTGLAHLAGAVLLFVAWKQTTFAGLWWTMFFYSLTYMPTIALTNGIAFYHMGKSDKFGNIRVWGTIGWIAIQFGLSFVLRYWETKTPGVSHSGDTLMFAGIAAIVMGFFCFTLPNTPPTKNAKNPYAFLEAFKLVSNKNFAVLLLVSFVVAIELPFYYNLTPIFFTEAKRAAVGFGGLGLTESVTQRAMLIGQCGELLMMLLLWPMLRRFGIRGTIFAGILGWPVRYAIFAYGRPVALVIASQALHGVCYTFFFVGGMIAVERLAHRDIRASAQALILFATNGLGMLAGHFLSGAIHDHFRQADGTHQWSGIFLLPIVVTVAAGIVFMLFFDEKKFREDSDLVMAEAAAA
jgi:nucleoside transporter